MSPAPEAPRTDIPAPEALAAPRYRQLLIPAFLVLFTLIKGLLWALTVAPLDAPDEPSHFNYLVQVRERHLLPVVVLVSPAGLQTPPSTPLNGAVRDWFARYDYTYFRSMPYESAQPPLYYWTAAVLTRPVSVLPKTLEQLLLAARLVSVLYGAGAVLALWLAIRIIAPHAGLLNLLAPLLLTLSPEFSFISSTVTNDAGAIFWGAALLLVWAMGIQSSRQGKIERRRLWLLCAAAGLATAAGVLTKLPFVATVPATLIWLWWVGPASATREAPRKRAGNYAFFMISLLIPVLPWVGRNLRVYGEPTGTRSILNLVHSIYWSRAQLPANQLFTQFPIDGFVVRSVRSFWALFGWATVWLDEWVYWLITALAMVALVGLIYRVAAVIREQRRGMRASGLALLGAVSALTCVMAFGNYVGYNSLVEFQPHMRYTFTSLAPLMLLLAVGIVSVPLPRIRVPLAAASVALLFAVQIGSLWVLGIHTQAVLSAVGK